MTTPRQIPLDLDFAKAERVPPFLTSETNFAAFTAVQAWQSWPHRRMAITGPDGAGKSHLARLWSEGSGADLVSAADLREAAVPGLIAVGALAIEDVDAVAALDPETAGAAELALFHLLNLAHAENTALLLTGRSAPGHWSVRTSGLASRLASMAHVRIAPPDDALLASILHKFFAERRISVTNDAILYLVRRIERSVRAAEAIVAEIDRFALERKRRVTRHLVAELFADAGHDVGHGDAAT